MNCTAFSPQEYDRKIGQSLPYYEDFYKQITDILNVSGKREIAWLDIGCGTGKMYEAAYEKIDISEFVFTDISEEMLNISKCRFSGKRNSFRKMAVSQLEEQGKYDVVTSVCVHHYLSEAGRETALKKCFLALKKGGIFFSFENIAPESEAGRQIALERWEKYQISKGKSRVEAHEHVKRYGTEYFPINVETHFETMRKCGFASVELIWLSFMQAGFMGMKSV